MLVDRCLNREDALFLSRTAEEMEWLSDAEGEKADALNEIVAQSRILPEGERAPGHVELNDSFTYEVTTTGVQHTVMLVTPEQVDPLAGKISFVSPVGLAVLGMPVGAEVQVNLPDGRQMSLKIVATVPVEKSAATA